VIAGCYFFQLTPVTLNLLAGAKRQQLNGPDDDLTEVADGGWWYCIHLAPILALTRANG
jgi:hypothetical protein